jgi:predicted acylesterase/phospholipase RssA
MTIKHLVISGGGPLGLKYLGALEKLSESGFWDINNIESIYGTSIGSIIGAFICLKYDWETLNTYIIERPWQDVINVNIKQILDSYYNKGLFDKSLLEIIFKPLLIAKNLDLNITLKEFYEFSKIDLHIFTFELNKYKSVELTHVTFPDLTLIQALTMSAALPGIFMPIIIDDCCYIDGSVLYNYPLEQCLRDHNNIDEILGIKSSENNNIHVSKETSLLEYIIAMTTNTMYYMHNNIKIDNIPNTVYCYINDNPLSLHYINECINNREFRLNWIALGNTDALPLIKNDAIL